MAMLRSLAGTRFDSRSLGCQAPFLKRVAICGKGRRTPPHALLRWSEAELAELAGSDALELANRWRSQVSSDFSEIVDKSRAAVEELASAILKSGSLHDAKRLALAALGDPGRARGAVPATAGRRCGREARDRESRRGPRDGSIAGAASVLCTVIKPESTNFSFLL